MHRIQDFMAPYFGLAKPNYVYLQTHLTRLQPYACEISRNEKKKFWYKNLRHTCFWNASVIFFIILGGGGSGGSIQYDTQTVNEGEKVTMECVSTGMI